MALLHTLSYAFFLSLLVSVLAKPVPDVDYDVIIVGGGPAGLSGLSGLGRVRRKALMYDSGEYRNGATRHMHDVIGNDGTEPAKFRGLAREQIAKYKTTEIKDIKVVAVEPVDDYFEVLDDEGGLFTSRKIMFGTGLKDILPDTPGLKDAWSKGVFWCPWCDGYEHRDQPFGILGPLSHVMGSVVEIETLNTDIIAFVNGTWNEKEEAELAKDYPNWRAQLDAYNVRLENRTVTSIDRLQDGGKVNDPVNHKEYDMFRINFSEGESIIRNAIMTNFPSVQRSVIPRDMGLNMTKEDKIQTNMDDMRTSMDGVFAIGDANSDSSTNVPHAMFSGKRAAVYVHVEMAKEESLDSIGKRGSGLTRRELEKEANRLIGENLEPLWERARAA